MAGSRRFLTHAAFLVEMIEKALNMLGEDDDALESMLKELGEKHVRYGVKPDYFPYMREAIIQMLHETLSVRFTEKDEDAWREVLAVLITDMAKAQRSMQMKSQAAEMKKSGNGKK